MYYLELKKMTFHACHGVMEQERKVGNTYTVDLKIGFDFRKAMETDRLNDTINYALIYEMVKQEMAVPSHLIEHVAGRILNRIRTECPAVETLEIRLAKKNPPFGGDLQEAAVIVGL
jgi:dihydroneopterin aldolase